MESNIKGLVAAGHEMASELKAECGAVDMRSVAKLISDLATQLEVQLVRANALAEDQQKAIESIKQADSAVKLAHEKFSVLAAENARLKAICEDRRTFIMNGVQLGFIKVPTVETDPALETIRIAISPQKTTPATDAFLDEMKTEARKEGAYFVANRMLAAWKAGFIDDSAKNAEDIARMILTSTDFMANAPEGDFDRSFSDGVLEDIAEQLRKGVIQ
ncbi:eae-like domain protein [Escherichia coli]|nr:eae-like domain protein [Escherichia coli]EET4192762.1 eae-like domain protein [Escherichia coli]EET4258316.1 eae-like domain protein [Escherichia coli]EET4319333.1 eae-like domain protein [Escherichia coli]EET4334270.1 eae-like domain protein [Escherichia coli]